MLSIDKIKESLSVFFKEIVNISEVPIGNINRTYLLEVEESTQRRKVVAQLINSKVFNLKAVASNLNLIDKLSRSNPDLEKILPVYLRFQGSVVCYDRFDQPWKFTEYIADSYCGRYPRSESDCYKAGIALAVFHRETRKVNIHRLRYSIRNFFKPKLRFQNFLIAISKGIRDRIAEVKKVLPTVKDIFEILSGSISLMEEMPKSVAHNDTKFENFVITKNGAILIDHDLVQPGPLAYDLGDFLRTICFHAAEDEPGHEPNLDFLEAACEGLRSFNYRKVFSGYQKALRLSPAIVTFILSLRFLTDYLTGDKYFRIWRQKQNLDRGLCQLERAQMLMDIADRIKL